MFEVFRKESLMATIMQTKPVIEDCTKKFRNSVRIDWILDNSPILAHHARDYVLAQEKILKQSTEYKEAEILAKHLSLNYGSFACNSFSDLEVIKKNPELAILFEKTAFPKY